MSKSRPNAVSVVFIKEGMPSVEEARRRLGETLTRETSKGTTVVKLVHGYGSSGKGGSLRSALRSSLRRRRREGVIQDFIAGEDWDIFDRRAQAFLEVCSPLRHDRDLNQANEGITIVLLKAQRHE